MSEVVKYCYPAQVIWIYNSSIWDNYNYYLTIIQIPIVVTCLAFATLRYLFYISTMARTNESTKATKGCAKGYATSHISFTSLVLWLMLHI